MKTIYYVAEENRVKHNGIKELMENLYIPYNSRKEARFGKMEFQLYHPDMKLKIYKLSMETVR